MLADGEQSSRDRKWMWVLRPAVREALQAADFFATDSRDFPDVVSQPLFEGAAISIRVNAYERNEIARRRCIEHYGTACSACSADLGSVYGPKAHGLIHVHHLRPLHELSEEYEVDPISDLRPVCPSCHAVIHRRDPPFTLSEIREMLAAQKKNK
jgi:predicted HNH restriction endonuclease